MSYLLILEVISVIFNILFLVFFTKENKVCWIFGILGSLLGAFVMYKSNLFSETILYLFYAFVGIYAYLHWHNKSTDTFKIRKSSVLHVFILVLSGFFIAAGLGFIMSKTKADKPYFDAISTVFGIIATFLEIYKHYIAWFFWIIINAYTVWLYQIKEINLFALQMVVYTILSIRGLVLWNKKLKTGV